MKFGTVLPFKHLNSAVLVFSTVIFPENFDYHYCYEVENYELLSIKPYSTSPNLDFHEIGAIF